MRFIRFIRNNVVSGPKFSHSEEARHDSFRAFAVHPRAKESDPGRHRGAHRTKALLRFAFGTRAYRSFIGHTGKVRPGPGRPALPVFLRWRNAAQGFVSSSGRASHQW